MVSKLPWLWVIFIGASLFVFGIKAPFDFLLGAIAAAGLTLALAATAHYAAEMMRMSALSSSRQAASEAAQNKPQSL